MTGPFHVVLRDAIQHRGLPLDRLRHRLAQQGIRVGRTTLSDWQQGRASPQHPNSLRAVDALERILGLPHRTLTGLLAPTGREEYDGVVGELLGALPRGHAWDLEGPPSPSVWTVAEKRWACASSYARAATEWTELSWGTSVRQTA